MADDAAKRAEELRKALEKADNDKAQKLIDNVKNWASKPKPKDGT